MVSLKRRDTPAKHDTDAVLVKGSDMAPVVTTEPEPSLGLPTGPELMAEIAKFPTIDVVMDRNPRTITEDDWKLQVERMRLERALFTVRDKEKRAKKKGEDDGE